ncbi:hypothetical protein EU538_09225 [Candidatus Thorarchaeota archaeon]|nr:MAG: hypothetical protein EU538_09225 [Candidatus Thorarchaeota archaeon]
MTSDDSDIVGREYRQGKVAYGFQWNRSNHQALGNTQGDLAALWAHLESATRGTIPEIPFADPFYTRASSLKLVKMSPASHVGFRRRLMKSGNIRKSVDNDLVTMIRDFHRAIDDLSYCADHGILKEFLSKDPMTLAIEVPVWSDHYQLSGHIDLVRYSEAMIQVCDYKPGPLESTKKRFFDSLPQVSAYGEMMTYHLASTLRSALDAPILPRVSCCIFDSHSSWHFGSELFVTLEKTGKIDGF